MPRFPSSFFIFTSVFILSGYADIPVVDAKECRTPHLTQRANVGISDALGPQAEIGLRPDEIGLVEICKSHGQPDDKELSLRWR